MRDTAAEAAPSRQVGSLLGPGWAEVQSFEDVEDLDEYEDEEEVGVSASLAAAQC